MANNWLTNGGCFNGMRWANDGAGAGARDWAEFSDTDKVAHPVTLHLILATSWDSDDMNTVSGNFELQWQNLTDAGSWTDLGSTGEIKWSSSTDLANNNAVASAEELGEVNCSGKNPTRQDGKEREGANSITISSVASKKSFDIHWAIDPTGATVGKEYIFRVVETGTSNSYGTMLGSLWPVTVGDVTGITKDDAGDVLVSCYVAIFQKIEGGGPPHDYQWMASTTSHGTTGAYTFSNLDIAQEHFVYAIKEDSPHVFDVTDDVLTPV